MKTNRKSFMAVFLHFFLGILSLINLWLSLAVLASVSGLCDINGANGTASNCKIPIAGLYETGFGLMTIFSFMLFFPLLVLGIASFRIMKFWDKKRTNPDLTVRRSYLYQGLYYSQLFSVLALAGTVLVFLVWVFFF